MTKTVIQCLCIFDITCLQVSFLIKKSYRHAAKAQLELTWQNQLVIGSALTHD